MVEAGDAERAALELQRLGDALEGRLAKQEGDAERFRAEHGIVAA